MILQRLRDCNLLMINQEKLLVTILSDDLMDGEGHFRVTSEQIDSLVKLLETCQEFDALVEMVKGESSRLKRII